MTAASHELALCVIDDGGDGPGPHYGSTYEERCDLAGWTNSAGAARTWLRLTCGAALLYHREFGGAAHWSDIFGAEDILACAAELAAYYREHVKEVA